MVSISDGLSLDGEECRGTNVKLTDLNPAFTGNALNEQKIDDGEAAILALLDDTAAKDTTFCDTSLGLTCKFSRALISAIRQ